MLVDILQKPTGLEIGYINDSGQVATEEVRTNYTRIVQCSKDDPHKLPHLKNWGNDSALKKIPFRYFDTLNLREYLLKQLPKSISDKFFKFNKPNVYCFDIEINMERGDDGKPCTEFPDPEVANFPIDSISISGRDMSIITLTTRPDRLKKGDNKKIEDKINKYFEKYDIPKGIIKNNSNCGKIRFNYLTFNSERELLLKFYKLQREMIHCIAGWNSKAFDCVYINNRAKKHGLSQALGSPVSDKKHAINRSTNSPLFRLEIDYMHLSHEYGKHDKKQDTLDYVSNKLLGVGKLEHEKSFLDFYMNPDYVRFLAYGAIDTLLVQMIHEKYHFLDNVLTMAYYTKAPILKSTSVTQIAENLWFDETMSNGYFNANYDFKIEKCPDFEGGYVVDPRRKTSQWVAILDYKSLYPSSMRQLNCSVEAHAGKIDIDDETQFKLAQAKGYAISLRGNLYKNNGDNYLKTIMNRLIEERYHYKRIMGKSDKIFGKVENELKERGVKLHL